MPLYSTLILIILRATFPPSDEGKELMSYSVETQNLASN